MVGIYHSRDLDGYCSGAILKLKFPDIKLIGYDYGQPIPWEEIPKGKPVIMVDVSLPMEEMMKLNSLSGYQLTWIDHHISAINEYKEATMLMANKEVMFSAVLQDGIAACEIAWTHFFPDQLMPESIKLLGEYDTWRNGDKERWMNEILPFQWGIRRECDSPETFPEVAFYDETGYVDSTIYEGNVILEYQASINQTNCRRNSFEVKFKGMKAICLNGGPFNSMTFDSVYDSNKHDLMMPFQFDGKQWTVSMYTTKDEIDCSKIAKEMGGGGHKKAAGFQVKNIQEVFGEIS